jgi:hypothetical protein
VKKAQRDRAASGEIKSSRSFFKDAFRVVLGRLLITFLLFATWSTVTFAL